VLIHTHTRTLTHTDTHTHTHAHKYTHTHAHSQILTHAHYTYTPHPLSKGRKCKPTDTVPWRGRVTWDIPTLCPRGVGGVRIPIGHVGRGTMAASTREV